MKTERVSKFAHRLGPQVSAERSCTTQRQGEDRLVFIFYRLFVTKSQL